MKKKQSYVSQECYWKIFTQCHNIFYAAIGKLTAAGISMKELLQKYLLKQNKTKQNMYFKRKACECQFHLATINLIL